MSAGRTFPDEAVTFTYSPANSIGRSSRKFVSSDTGLNLSFHSVGDRRVNSTVTLGEPRIVGAISWSSSGTWYDEFTRFDASCDPNAASIHVNVLSHFILTSMVSGCLLESNLDALSVACCGLRVAGCRSFLISLDFGVSSRWRLCSWNRRIRSLH